MDRDHLRLLAIFHYLLAGVFALMIPLAAAPAAIGAILSRMLPPEAAMPPEMKTLLSLAAVALVIAGIAGVVGLALTGFWLSRARHYWFCFISAACNTFFWPFGTILAIFTIIVLVRPSVKALFGVAPGGNANFSPPGPTNPLR